MNIFIIGLPGSGRSTVAKSICLSKNYRYIQSSSWIKDTFREQDSDEKIESYIEEYNSWFINRMKSKPNIIIDHVIASIESYAPDCYRSGFVIDGIFSPRDFVQLFDCNKDLVIFLNRIDNDIEYKDYESIGYSSIKDYCFWLASVDILSKERWVEVNFKIPGHHSDVVKVLGSKNTIYMVKNLIKGIDMINNHIK